MDPAHPKLCYIYILENILYGGGILNMPNSSLITILGRDGRGGPQ